MEAGGPLAAVGRTDLRPELSDPGVTCTRRADPRPAYLCRIPRPAALCGCTRGRDESRRVPWVSRCQARWGGSPRWGIPVWDGPGNRVNGGYDATARPRSGRRAARCKGPRAAHMRTLRSVRSSATIERIVADEGVVAVTWPPGPRGYLPPGRSRPVLGHREEFAGLRAEPGPLRAATALRRMRTTPMHEHWHKHPRTDSAC